ncbi:hypothetical protein [Actinoalloteichus fjordicus]|nr:hypothetical protein [Actinoalloteichus fjordicus]
MTTPAADALYARAPRPVHRPADSGRGLALVAGGASRSAAAVPS